MSWINISRMGSFQWEHQYSLHHFQLLNEMYLWWNQLGIRTIYLQKELTLENWLFNMCDYMDVKENKHGSEHMVARTNPRGTAEEEPNVMVEAEVEMEDAEEEVESPGARDRRYRESNQDEVSEPDHWSMLHYGHLAWDDHERMLSFSQANQIRLNRAINTLQERRQAAEVSGNWYEAAQIAQAISEVESLRDIA